MACLSDIPHVWKTVGPFGFAKRVVRETLDDYVFTWAASLAYSWMFAVFPFLIFLLALLPYLPDPAKHDATNRIKDMIAQAIPSEAGNTLQRELDNLVETPRGGLLSIGILFALYAASGGMAATMVALDRCYDIEVSRPYVQTRAVAIGLTITVATLILALICLMPVGTSMLRWAREYELIPAWAGWAINLGRYTAAAVLMFTILSLVYYFGPSVRGRWRWVTPGSLFVVVVWVMLGFAFRWYIDRFGAASYARTYGAIGSVAILLLVFYIDAIVLLIGAEINSEVDFAVLGVGSSSAGGQVTPPKPRLSDADHKLLRGLRRRRPQMAVWSPPPPSGGATPTPDDRPASSA